MELPIRQTVLDQAKAKRIYVFHEKSSLDHYRAQAYVVRCVDDRFFRVYKNYLKVGGINRLDSKTPAGGAKVFSSPIKKGDRDYNIRELELSIRLHHVNRVMLFTHHDCGAYGGFAAFDNDHDKEFKFHSKEHEKAAKYILARFPELIVETYFVDEHGIVRTSQ
ncbi:MAG: hypothetical protein HYT62_01945 [Candidatus Yanofskybacteria bacterium]|nr:hypothetical protein [Candidatus Yanofskybacteria bacterium]